ncbi:MAG TPA: carbohydrate kinase family protein [Bacteroidota bacterium]|nr:carbohydrate kinase family protein [Bacteroidota bacterium]
MIIPVIGHLCLDIIEHPDKTETQSYGGIFFSVVTLANLLSAKDTIRPVFGVGKSDYDELIERLSRYPNVDSSGIFKFNGPTNQVRLMYSSKEQRIECSQSISEPIPWKRIRPELSHADMVLVNMISGMDITLETLDEIRMDVRDDHVPVYLDVHSLTLGINPDFTRFHRSVEQWRRWLFMLHAVHLNEEEASILTSERLDEPSLAKHVLAMNTKTLHITRGKRGCTAYVDEHKHIQRADFAGIEPEKGIDPTGCGDVFVAAYCAHYMKFKNINTAVEFANRVAARKAQMPGSTDIDTLSSFRVEDLSLQERPV